MRRKATEPASPLKRTWGEGGFGRCKSTIRLRVAQMLSSKGGPRACPFREVGGEVITMGQKMGEDGVQWRPLWEKEREEERANLPRRLNLDY